MAKAYSYVRFSHPSQMEGDSVRRQVQATEEYVKEHGLILDATLNMRDLGLSAFTPDNNTKGQENITKGALGAFIEAVKSNRVEPGSYLIVESLDRISRAEVMDALELFTTLVNSGINIVTLSDRQTYSREGLRENPYQIFVSLGDMGRAYKESQLKSKRISAAWSQKLNNAGKVRVTRMCPNWLRATDAGFEIIEEKAATIRRIFELKADGYGKMAIAQRLNAEKVPTLVVKRRKEGSPDAWHGGTIQQLLGSKTLLGEYQPHTGRGKERSPIGEPIKDYYPRIISDDLWVRTRSRDGSKRAGRGVAMRNVFRGLLRCGECGGTMTTFSSRDWKRQNTKIYLGCYNKHRGICSIGTQWNYDDFLQSFLKFVTELDPTDLVNKPDSIQPLKDRVRVLTHAAEELKAQCERIVCAIELGNGQLGSLVERLGQLEQQRTLVLADLSAVLAVLDSAEILDKDARRTVEEITDILRLLNGDDADRYRIRLNKLLHSVIKRIEVHPQGVTWKPPTFPKEFTTERYYSVVFKNDDIRIVRPEENSSKRLMLGKRY